MEKVMLCIQCGSANRFDAHFCSICGRSIVSTSTQTDAPALAGSRRHAVSTRQYCVEDIEELLMLRRAMEQEKIAIGIVNQVEIDKIFEEP
jgi:hypothetical protein